jgi:DNA-binding MarR family transcriptional regulator
MKYRASDDNAALEQKLDVVIGLLQHLVALEMAREGTPKQAIAKHLRLAKATVVSMLKGVSLDGRQHE